MCRSLYCLGCIPLVWLGQSKNALNPLVNLLLYYRVFPPTNIAQFAPHEAPARTQDLQTNQPANGFPSCLISSSEAGVDGWWREKGSLHLALSHVPFSRRSYMVEMYHLTSVYPTELSFASR